MLTVPKLAHHPQHKRQNTLENLLVTRVNPQTKLNIAHTRSDRIISLEVQNSISTKKQFQVPQSKNISSIDPIKRAINDETIKTIRSKNPIYNELKILPQKITGEIKKQLQKQNLPLKKRQKQCFSPKYLKQREQNEKILQSLKLENEKYKKFILQNQYLNKKENNKPISQLNYLIQSQKIHQTAPNMKKIPQKDPFYHPRRALQEMTQMTNSFIIDDTNSFQFQTSFNQVPTNSQKYTQKNQKMSIFDFQKLSFLGKGNFGQVNLVRHKKTNFICAMKTIKKSFAAQQNVIHQISRQIRIHLSLKHLNIIAFYGYFDDTENVYLLIQYATGGELYKRLKECYRMPEKEVVPIVKNALDGLKMIHQLGYIHRDLKPQNMIFQFGIGKICDLGWAADCGFNQMRKSYCGTPLYLPPEMIRKQNYDQSADIWSIGILTYELLVGKIPFNIWSEYDLQQIVDRQIRFPTQYVDMSNQCIDFMKKCLTKDPNQRVKLQSLINHPFLNRSQEGYFNAELYDAVERLF